MGRLAGTQIEWFSAKQVMTIEKLDTVIRGREYTFTVQIMQSDEETFYRVTPDEEDEFLAKRIPTYIDFDERGNVDMEEKFSEGESKEVVDAIWRALKREITSRHPSFSVPLEEL
jgi:hypothetical protein